MSFEYYFPETTRQWRRLMYDIREGIRLRLVACEHCNDSGVLPHLDSVRGFDPPVRFGPCPFCRYGRNPPK